MSRFRYESSEVRKAKAVRRELIRPLRLLLDDTPFSLRLNKHYLDRAYIEGVGTLGLTIDLAEPIDPRAILDWMEENLDRHEEWLDDQRDRVARARQRCEEATQS